MALTDENGGLNVTMPVAPSMYGGNGGFGFGNDWSWIIILFLFGIFGNGWGGGFGGGFGGGDLYPWMNNSNQINDGFRDQMLNTTVTGIQNSVTAGFGDVQNSLCAGFAGVSAAVNGAQNAIAQQMYTNQISDLERSFAAQTANTQAISALSTQMSAGFSDNKTQSIANTQAVLDKLCQLELDGYKRENDSLRAQLSDAKVAASQAAQNAFIAQGLNNEVDALYNRLSSCPVPTTPVYGRTPIFTCGNQGCGCGA